MNHEESQEFEKNTSPKLSLETLRKLIEELLYFYDEATLIRLIFEVSRQKKNSLQALQEAFPIDEIKYDRPTFTKDERVWDNPNVVGDEDFLTILSALILLDKSIRDSVETISPAETTAMGIEGRRESQEIAQLPPPKEVKELTREEELAQRFIYEDENKIPSGMNHLQLNFLRDAALAGAFQQLTPKAARTIAEYYSTNKTYEDIAKEENVTHKAVRDRIINGMGKLHSTLYKHNPTLQQVDPYPLEEIQKGKDRREMARSEKSHQRRVVAGKKGAKYGYLGAEYGHLGAEYGKLGGRPRKIDVFDAKQKPSQ